ncbi:hypothetical protein BV25DRAFT_1868922 [Artomyces pyxidatus]|uniref:Uncharacterized protein n=1 Tax=Artomyces pyxidatus TaxID=48021 RepID=A0ACB8TAX4_9AGAM|nr:hypothetical protein BV25DRAFT_1868922 [Artomyces pyxidatus]
MSDPVAAKSGFLCMYMSNHPDTLVSYAKHFGHVKDHILSAKMLAIDTNGMDLSYITKSNSSAQSVRVPFDPPLAGYEEVKPRLMGMKADADEALGTVKAPQITSFHLPFGIWQTTSLILLLCYVTFTPAHDPAPYWGPAHLLRGTIAVPLIRSLSWAFVVLMHGGEAVYAALLAKKHRMPWNVAISYVLGIFVWGYPVLFDVRRRIQAARIDSIMKGN